MVGLFISINQYDWFHAFYEKHAIAGALTSRARSENFEK